MQLIEQYEINTQGALQEKLEEAGFEVTQTTISRDIRQLKLVKGQTERGTYKYVLPGRSGADSVFNSAIVAAVRHVEAAGNLVVVRTQSGMANAVAVCVETVTDERVLGCVAGDDTIFIALYTPQDAQDFSVQLHRAFGL